MTEEMMSQETIDPKARKKLSLNFIFPAVAVLIILIVVFQAFEISQLRGYAKGIIESGAVQGASAVAPARSSGSALPSQVGGC